MRHSLGLGLTVSHFTGYIHILPDPVAWIPSSDPACPVAGPHPFLISKATVASSHLPDPVAWIPPSDPACPVAGPHPFLISQATFTSPHLPDPVARIPSSQARPIHATAHTRSANSIQENCHCSPGTPQKQEGQPQSK
jgi:hypothetical protein